MIAALVRSNPNVAQKRPSAESRVASMRRPVTLPGCWPKPKRLSNHAMTGSALRCCFAHLKRILKLGRLRLRGPRGAQDEFTLAAIAQNLRRLAKLIVRPPPAAGACAA